MCHAVQYEWQGKTITEYFHYRYAKLPVLQRDGETRLYPWGRHQQELGHLPLGGWATQEQIYRGAWDKFTPIPVKLPISAFMEKDFEERPHWFTVVSGQFIQGLAARHEAERRIYLVTLIPERPDTPFARWPNILLEAP